MGEPQNAASRLFVPSRASARAVWRPNHAADALYRVKDQLPLRSAFLGRRPLYPHFLHRVAFHALRALHFMHILTRSIRASASGNRAMMRRPISPI